MTELESKPVPLTFNRKAEPPTVADAGSRVEIVGTPACWMVMLPAELVPALVATVMLAVPVEAMRLAGTAAVSCVELTLVVARAELFQFTTALESKLAPFTVSVNAEPPTVTEDGLMVVMLGAGSWIVKVLTALVPAFVVTVMLEVPAEAIKLAGTLAVTVVPLT